MQRNVIVLGSLAWIVGGLALVLAPAPAAAQACGGIGQRACCWLEKPEIGACVAGAVEVPGCFGDCLCTNSFLDLPIRSSGSCVPLSDCGGEGERACCALENPDIDGAACEPNLVAVEGCSGNCLCKGGAGAFQTCAQPTFCGGEGQRACLSGERPDIVDCEAGTVRQLGCTGDCTSGIEGFLSLSSCVGVEPDGSLKRIAEPETNWIEPSDDRSYPVEGYADIHVHLMAHLAHGKRVFAGKPAPIDGAGDVDAPGLFDYDPSRNLTVNEALNSKADFDIHGFHDFALGDPIGTGTKDGARDPDNLSSGFSGHGSPSFNNWPRWTTTTHQQMYYKWLERAFRGGLRLTVMLAVTNEALCRGRTDAPEEERLCNLSMPAIDAQLKAARNFEKFIDDQCVDNPGSGFCAGSPEEGWFRIVKSPLEAREAIAEGKLAVVLGIEVDHLFNCKKHSSCPNGLVDANGDEITTLPAAVNYYYDIMDVRHIFPIHNFDNAFGGPATWQTTINAGNRAVEGEYWSTELCPQVDGRSFGVDVSGAVEISLPFGFFEFDLVAPENEGGPGPSCNASGLTTLGRTLVDLLMDKGMIIDIDHMSIKAIDDTLALAQLRSPVYPLVASHVQFFDLNQEEIRHERMRTPAQLEAIRDTGGMIAAMTKDDQQDTGNKGLRKHSSYDDPELDPPVADNCRHSSRTFAQMYQYAVDVMNAPVAFGSDFNGVAGHVGPRFGSNACGGIDVPVSNDPAGTAQERSAQLRRGDRLEYPFELRPGFGTFDEQVSGQKTFDFNVDGLAHVGLLPDLVKDLEVVGLAKPYRDALFNSAEEYIRMWERAEAIAKDKPIPGPEDIPEELRSPDGVVNLCADTDFEPPEVICPADVFGVECMGPGTVANFGLEQISATEDACGPATVVGCTANSGEQFTLGTSEVTCAAVDASGNVGSCMFDITVLDTVSPNLIGPANLTGVECTSHAGASPDFGSATVVDACEPGVVASNNAPSIFPIGTTSVTWTAVDTSGNGSIVMQSVEVVDTTDPTITCPARITEECTGAESATVTPGEAAGTDLCTTSAALEVTSFEPQSFDLGTTFLEYTAIDAQGRTSSCFGQIEVVDTTDPTIICPAPIVAECVAARQAVVTPGAATATDICDPSVPVDLKATADFPLGITTVGYFASDGSGNQDSCSATIEVVDTTPPTISSVEATPAMLSPPNGKMVPVAISVDVSDTCDAGISVPGCSITAISSNEPAGDGRGAGAGPDWQITGALTADLRSERLGGGSGREYTLEITCTDNQGLSSVDTAMVFVPHDQASR